MQLALEQVTQAIYNKNKYHNPLSVLQLSERYLYSTSFQTIRTIRPHKLHVYSLRFAQQQAASRKIARKKRLEKLATGCYQGSTMQLHSLAPLSKYIFPFPHGGNVKSFIRKKFVF